MSPKLTFILRASISWLRSLYPSIRVVLCCCMNLQGSRALSRSRHNMCTGMLGPRLSGISTSGTLRETTTTLIVSAVSDKRKSNIHEALSRVNSYFTSKEPEDIQLLVVSSLFVCSEVLYCVLPLYSSASLERGATTSLTPLRWQKDLQLPYWHPRMETYEGGYSTRRRGKSEYAIESAEGWSVSDSDCRYSRLETARPWALSLEPRAIPRIRTEALLQKEQLL